MTAECLCVLAGREVGVRGDVVFIFHPCFGSDFGCSTYYMCSISDDLMLFIDYFNVMLSF